MIEIDQKKVVKVRAKEIQLHLKVRDDFTASLVDQDGEVIFTQEDGYVPGFMPGEHYGDYVLLNIDLETGQVTNWDKPTARQIQEWIKTFDED